MHWPRAARHWTMELVRSISTMSTPYTFLNTYCRTEEGIWVNMLNTRGCASFLLYVLAKLLPAIVDVNEMSLLGFLVLSFSIRALNAAELTSALKMEFRL